MRGLENGFERFRVGKREFIFRVFFFFFFFLILYIRVEFGPGMPNTRTQLEPASGFLMKT